MTVKLDIHCQQCCTDWQKDKNQNYAKATCALAGRAVTAGRFSDLGRLRLKPFLMARMTEKPCFATAPSLNSSVVMHCNRFAPRTPECFFFRHPLWHELANDNKHNKRENNGDCNIFLAHEFLQANAKLCGNFGAQRKKLSDSSALLHAVCFFRKLPNFFAQCRFEF